MRLNPWNNREEDCRDTLYKGELEEKYPHDCCIHARQVFSRGKCYHALCVDVFVEDEHTCKAVRAVHVSNTRHRNGCLSKSPSGFLKPEVI